jgi:hypothetical protein
MSIAKFEIPILFLVFKRAESALRVLEQIRKIRPTRLFIAADGPRQGVEGESTLCSETRKKVEARIDWDCQVIRLYRDGNLGCQEAVSSAIDWFFSQVEEGIVLEDDTLPDPSFFRFCEVLLKRYRTDSRVMHVSGNNYQGARIRGDGAYYGSQFAHSWGWATWARAWSFYDSSMPGFPEEWDELSAALGYSPARSAWWRHSLEQTLAGKVNTWDWQWHYTIMRLRGLCLLPQVNLVENIGVGINATHTVCHTNSSRTRARKLLHFHEPSTLQIRPEWDEFDFQHSVLNYRYPWRTFSEWWEFKKHCS